MVHMLRDAPAAGPAQTVGRSIHLLRLVASSKSRNLRLVDIAEMAGLDKSTAHRLLQRLVVERMLVKDRDVGGYMLGPLLHELGLAALPCSDLPEVARDALDELARSTGDSVFLVQRSGCDTVCVARMQGKFSVETMTQGVGDRHPLGLGAGGLSILSAMDDSEIDAVFRTVALQLRRYQIEEAVLRQRIDDTRQSGFALGHGSAALDVTSIGRPVFDAHRSPVAAVFVAMVSDRTGDARLRMVDRQLRQCVLRVEEAQRSRTPVRTGAAKVRTTRASR
jgi:DNA-binding IclR family transcriptional regulator